MAPFDAPDAITELICDFALNHTREGHHLDPRSG
jgi:hypothetical protein